jgi:hypothetical protein
MNHQTNRILALAALLACAGAHAGHTVTGHAVHLSGKSEVALPRQCPPQTPADIQAGLFKSLQLIGEAARLGEIHERRYVADGLAAVYRESYGIGAIDMAHCTARVEKLEHVELVHGSGAQAVVYLYDGRRRAWSKRARIGDAAAAASSAGAAFFAGASARLRQSSGTMKVAGHTCSVSRNAAGPGVIQACLLSAGEGIPASAAGRLLLYGHAVQPDGRLLRELRAQRVELNVALDAALFQPPAQAGLR